MDSDQGKLFIGGISWETSEERLKDYFGNYGEVIQTVIMRDKMTGRPRGFGFVVFSDPSILDRVLQDKHTIDGRTVEAKRALSREEQQTTGRTGNSHAGRTGGGGGGGGNTRTKKIFVGGLPSTLSEDEFRLYFQTYGNVTDVVVMYDQTTQRPRGFGFISFDEEEAVDRVLHKTFHELNGKMVEVKRALPKDANTNTGTGGRSGGGGSYQSYGGISAVNSSSYDGRMDANKGYIQPQTASSGGYPSYGSSGYGAPSYGYSGGYGVGGFGGPPGPYGNPNAPTSGYVSGGPPGAQRSPWNNQAPTAYALSGYGSAPNNPTGQSPNAPTSYGNQGYGYGGGYGGADGSSYGSQGGYGAVGGRVGVPNSIPVSGSEQGAGYGDPNGNSGYSHSWRSDPSQGGYAAGQVSGPPGGYGGGYGGPQSRQVQQQ